MLFINTYFSMKKLNRVWFILLISFIVGCNANESFIEPIKPQFETISFDAVQKQLISEEDLPNHLQILISKWFNEEVKVNGFDGNLIFKFYNYTQKISSIDNGKRVDLSISFNVFLNKPVQSKKEFIKGEVFSYSTLSGDFTLYEFDTVIQNTQYDLILRLSRDLKSKI